MMRSPPSLMPAAMPTTKVLTTRIRSSRSGPTPGATSSRPAGRRARLPISL
jgi:hypothetical protein